MTDTTPTIQCVSSNADLGRAPTLRLTMGSHSVPLPGCPAKDDEACRLVPGPVSSTGLPRNPIYDRQGRDVSIDPNLYLCVLECKACGARWQLRVEKQQTSINQIRPPKPHFSSCAA